MSTPVPAPPAGPPGVLRLDDLAGTVLDAPPRLGPVHLMAVDGPSGSGKTTLAARVEAAFTRHPRRPRTALVHLDDLYEGWSGMRSDRGSGTVSTRLVADLLDPLRAGRAGGWRRYDWHAHAFAEWHAVPAADVVVLEGCGAADPAFDAWTSIRLWVEAPESLRTQRGLDRDGAQMTAHLGSWRVEEDAMFTDRRTRDRADLRVDGAPSTPHDPDLEVVLLDPSGRDGLARQNGSAAQADG